MYGRNTQGVAYFWWQNYEINMKNSSLIENSDDFKKKFKSDYVPPLDDVFFIIETNHT